MQGIMKLSVLVLMAVVMASSIPSVAKADEGGTTFDLGKLFAPEDGKKADWMPEKFKLKLAGFGQILFNTIENDKDATTSTVDTWRVSRFRFKGKMTADKNLSAFFQIDFVQDITLMDAFASWKINDYLCLKAGQFVIPFGWQMPIAPSSLATINYGQTVALCPVTGGFRDQGAWLGGTYGRNAEIGEKKGPVYWDIALVNGSGRVNFPDDKYGAKCARIGIQPIRPNKEKKDMLDFGISYWTELQDDGAGGSYDRGRLGIDFRYHSGCWVVQGEYVSKIGDTYELGETPEGEIEASAYFIEVGYKYQLTKDDPETKTPAKYIQPMLRYDVLDTEDVALAPYGKSTIIALGFNYILSPSATIQIFFEQHNEEEDDLSGNELHNDEFLAQIVFTF